MGAMPVDYFTTSLEGVTDVPRSSTSLELGGHHGLQTSHYTEKEKGTEKSRNFALF